MEKTSGKILELQKHHQAPDIQDKKQINLLISNTWIDIQKLLNMAEGRVSRLKIKVARSKGLEIQIK
jgi:hypothetical protein